MSRKAAGSDAIKKLAAAKRGATRLADMDFDEDKAVYDEVDDQAYQALVAKRRADNDFVVDDDGLGYADDGEEHMGRDDGDADDDDDGEDIDDELDELDDLVDPGSSASGAKGEGAKEKRKSKVSAASKLKSGKGVAGMLGLDAFVSSGLGGGDVVKANTVGGINNPDFDAMMEELDDNGGADSGAAASRRRGGMGMGLGSSSLNGGGVAARGRGVAAGGRAAGGFGRSTGTSSFLDLDREIDAAAPVPVGADVDGFDVDELDDELHELDARSSAGAGAGASAGAAAAAAGAMAEDEGDADADAGGAGAAGARRVVKLAAAARTTALAPSQAAKLAREEAAKRVAAAAAAAAAALAPAPGTGGWLGAGAGDDAAAAGGSAAAGGAGAGGVIIAGAAGSTSPGAIAGSVGSAAGPLPLERVPMPHRNWLDKPAEVVGRPVDSLLFYWLDAHEDRTKPGTLYLFGKVMTNAKEVLAATRINAASRELANAAAAAAAASAASGASSSSSAAGEVDAASSPPAAATLPTLKAIRDVTPRYASACVAVSGLERCVYVLPRERTADGGAVTFVDVYNELLELTRRHLGAHTRVSMKRVTRSYAFELPDVPREPTAYLKIVYDGRLPQLPANLTGRTFSRVFATNASHLENFLLKRDLMGPCWLRVLNATPASTPASWCAYDVAVDNPKNVLKYGQLVAAPSAAASSGASAGAGAGASDGAAAAAAPAPAAAIPPMLAFAQALAAGINGDASSGAAAAAGAAPATSPSSSAAPATSMTPAAMMARAAEVTASMPLSLVETVPLPPPELVVMSLSLKTVVHPKTHAHEIVALTMLTHKAVNCDGPSREDPVVMSSLTLLRPLSAAQPLPTDLRPAVGRLAPAVRAGIGIEANERALLNRALMHIGKMDPDVLVGHNICGFDLDVLLHRCDKNGTATWSRIGRFRRTQMPRASLGAGGRATYATGTPAAGRLVCDTYLSARELVLKVTTYTMSHLANVMLKEKRAEIDPLDVPTFLAAPAAADRTLQLLQHTEYDARLALRLMFALQVLPLTKQLTNLSGNLWSRSLRGARAERIEFLLLHEFHRLKYVLPDKERPVWASSGGKGGKGGADEDDDPAAELALLHGDDDDAGDDGEGAPVTSTAASKSGKGKGSKGKGGSGGGATGTIARHSKKRAKAAYAGGLVLEPKKGLYDKFVLLLDFNSLYPSIIQEYNICFTTVERTNLMAGGAGAGAASEDAAAAVDAADEEGEDAAGAAAGSSALTAAGVALPDLVKYPDLGVLPRVIRTLVLRRRQVKGLLAKETDPARRQALDIRQQALKILANSMYGCLGFSNSRFYAKPLAALVTSQGREILQRTVTLAETTIGCDVIYGDTDSIMIYTGKTDVREVKQLGAAVKREVNKLYKYLEIEIDGIFASMLLLKKKKYAALVVEEMPGNAISTRREAKGLDLVRRDWCGLSKDLGTAVLDAILSGKERDEIVDAIHTLMTTAGEDMRAGKVPIDKYVITKGLNKHPSDYPDVKGQPHLQVALNLIKAGRAVNVGDHIPYVICKEAAGSVNIEAAVAAAASGAAGGAGAAPTDAAAGADGAAASSSSSSAGGPAARAWHPDDVRKGVAAGVLSIDVEWYLTQQILPPVSRLCEPIAGTSQQRLATCLGLDASRFAARVGGAAGARDEDGGFVPRYVTADESRFAACDRLIVGCSACGEVRPFPGVFQLVRPPAGSGATQAALASGLSCARPGCPGAPLPVTLPPGIASSSDRALETASLPSVPAGLDHFEYSRAMLSNAVNNKVRSAVLLHQQGVAFCDEPVCPYYTTGTRAMTTRKEGFACPRTGCRGLMAPDYPHAKLHTQIEYLAGLFNEERERRRRKAAADAAAAAMTKGANPADFVDVPSHVPVLPPLHSKALEALHETAEAALRQSAFHVISSTLFKYVDTVNEKYGMSSGRRAAKGKAAGGRTAKGAAAGKGVGAAVGGAGAAPASKRARTGE